MQEKKKILITGGLGYVGGRIVKALLDTGEFIIYIATRKNTIEGFFEKNELLKIINSKEVFSFDHSFEHTFECIIHLAAFNEIDCVKHPVEAAEFNIISSLILLQKAIQSKSKHFIYFSTAHVYGSPLQGKIDENVLPRPVHPYSITHKAFEDYLLAARDKNEINGIVFRLSNSFGVPINKDVNRWTLLINDLCKQAALGNQLKLNSSGLQQRDFITLTDVVNAVLFIINLNKEETKDGLFNLGGNYTKSIIEITNLVSERAQIILKKEMQIVLPAIKETPTENLKPLQFSSEKLKSIGFKWTNDINEEIDHLLVFCNEQFTI